MKVSKTEKRETNRQTKGKKVEMLTERKGERERERERNNKEN